jgi:hypothetical protein
MGGLSSFATQAFQVLGAVNTVMGAVNQFSSSSGSRDYDFQRQQNEVAIQNARAMAENKKQEHALEAKIAEEARRDALRRAIAKQRASYGGNNIDSSSGSAQAVLLGKYFESDQDQKNADTLLNIKKAGLDTSVGNMQRVNTLQLTQAREKNKYSQFTAAYDFASTIGGMLKE